jgi:molecular chaperone DnaK (HSP70)
MDRTGRQVVLVYDLGGGTFDATLIDMEGRRVTVLGTEGDHNLGGRDWDNALAMYLTEQYAEQTGDENLLDSEEALQELLLKAEEAKKALTSRDRTKVTVQGSERRAVVEVTRADFEARTAHLLEKTVSLARDMLEAAARAGHRRLDKLLLVGGSTRMPQVAARLKTEFGRPVEAYDPDEAVAKGAALFGWKLSLNEQVIFAVAGQTGQAPEEIALEEVPAPVLAEARQEVADRLVEELCLPAKAVEGGLTLQLRSAASKTFGIVARAADGQEKVSNLILRNAPVPALAEKRYKTVEIDQETVEIRLMENLSDQPLSETRTATEIGRSVLALPRGLPAGSPIVVRFRLNEQGRLEVTATEPGSGKTCELTVATAGTLSEADAAEARRKSAALVMA